MLIEKIEKLIKFEKTISLHLAVKNTQKTLSEYY